MLGLALVDSLNPSVIAVTIYLVLTGRDVVRRVLVYVCAVFLFYLTAGLLLVTGLTAVLRRWGDAVDSPAAYAAQAAVGAAMLLYGALAPSTGNRPPRERRPHDLRLAALFALGLTVSLVEFATALPYLAAIGLIGQAGLSPAAFLPLLVLYNAVMVLPPLVLLAATSLAGNDLRSRLDRWRPALTRSVRTTFLTVLAVVGFYLLADALVFFLGVRDAVRDAGLGG